MVEGEAAATLQPHKAASRPALADPAPPPANLQFTGSKNAVQMLAKRMRSLAPTWPGRRTGAQHWRWDPDRRRALPAGGYLPTARSYNIAVGKYPTATPGRAEARAGRPLRWPGSDRRPASAVSVRPAAAAGSTAWATASRGPSVSASPFPPYISRALLSAAARGAKARGLASESGPSEQIRAHTKMQGECGCRISWTL